MLFKAMQAQVNAHPMFACMGSVYLFLYILIYNLTRRDHRHAMHAEPMTFVERACSQGEDAFSLEC